MSNSTTLLHASFIADPIGIFWKASDLANFEPAYASALASKLKIKFTANPTQGGSRPPNTASPGSSPGLPENTAGTSSDTLSTGAKAGIGVGAVLGAIVLGALVFCFCIWRRRRNSHAQTVLQEEPATDATPEVGTYYDPGKSHEMGHYGHVAAHPVELGGTSNTQYAKGPAPSAIPIRELP